MQEFDVGGMTCAHRERALKDAVRALGVGAAVPVDLAAGTVSTVPSGRLVEATRDAGHGVGGCFVG